MYPIVGIFTENTTFYQKNCSGINPTFLFLVFLDPEIGFFPEDKAKTNKRSGLISAYFCFKGFKN